jgi:two-component system, NtrC family, sensor kinase
MFGSVRWIHSPNVYAGPFALRPSFPLVVVAVLLSLGLLNVFTRATWRAVEDGVFWQVASSGVVVAEIAAGSPAAEAGLRRGDTLLTLNDRAVQTARDVESALRASQNGGLLRYTILRPGSPEPIDVTLAPRTLRAPALYFVLAIVGVITLLVGGAVRLRRPRDPATLHFFWLAVSFFGVLTFSFTGRFDRLDWTFYWADAIATLALPPLFLHFTRVFPDRPRRRGRLPMPRVLMVLAYGPAVLLGLARVVALLWGGRNPRLTADIVGVLDRADYLYLALCVIAGLVGLGRALTEVTTITARRQLRWIVWGTALGGAPFAVLYAIPFAFAIDTSMAMTLSAVPLSIIPLAYASAIVRYRLLDIEVILKRTAVYAVVLCAIVVIYVVLLDVVDRFLRPGGPANQWVLALLATLVAVILAPPVKSAVQTLLDRAFYRDRYDYRRALVGFARDLNRDLDLNRLSERLVSRVAETFGVDRMALMLETEATTHFASVRASGFGDLHPPALARRSDVGARLASGHAVALDDPIAVGWCRVEEIEFWRDAGLYYFLPCVAKDGTIAVLALGRRESGAHLNSEDLALLGAVAGQIATALENAQLYRQLHLKALELDRLRAFNENILESLDEGLLVLNLDDRIVRWNTALETLYGVSRADAVGRSLDEVFDAAFVDAVRASRRESPAGAALSRIPLPLRSAASTGARALSVNASVVPLRASDGSAPTTVGTIIIVEDVTARVQLEEQLQISEKMASIGLLAAGVAHEVNTPLTGISSFTQMLLEGADPADPKTRLLEKIERQTFRAAKIVNGLLNLARPRGEGSTDRRPVDLNAVITDVLSLLEHQFHVHHVQVRRELSEEAPVVLGIEHKLQQVFLNLFLNARDAMPKGGWLSVRTCVEGERVVAEVGDTGTGIPNEYLTRIYDPFFTTKVIGEGTGLGLSITYGIIREHDGSIDCESTMGQGTRFTISLRPAMAERPALAGQR